MKIKNLKIGADPELFLHNGKEIISAEGLIGGTKTSPKLISEEGHAIQEDNIMVEFNIPPSSTLEEFKDNINYVKDYLTTMCTLMSDSISLNYSASAEINPKYLDTPQAKEFGCEPDYNVYLKCTNDPPNSNNTLRSCGGHIHIGYDNPDQEITEKIIYAMDMVLGLQSLTLDKDDRRKEMYGKAGCFRFKEYGCEFRTLSNFWVANDDLIEWAYESTLYAIELVNSEIIDELIEKYSDNVKLAIDSNNKQLANNLIDQINKEFKESKKESVKK